MADDARWEMVLLDVERGDVDPFHAHPVHHGDRVVGVITSGGHGHRTGRTLALAYLRERGLRQGLSAEILGRRCPVRVLDKPPFDPSNWRLKS